MGSNTNAPPPALFKLFRHVDASREVYIKNLRQAVAFKSVSSQPECWPEVTRMLTWTAERLKKLGATTEICPVQHSDLTDNQGRHIQPPPILLSTLGSTPGHKRLLVYCHVDVAPGWEKGSGSPFELAVSLDGETLKGRGALDCKGPLLCWLQAVEAYQKLNLDLPVNIKFIVQGAHEIGCPGLEELLRQRKNSFLRDVDAVCVTDCMWLRNCVPSVLYGLRGLSYFNLTVSGPSQDLHSGDYGGMVDEPLTDLVYLLNALQDREGRPKIPGIDEDVLPFTHEEENLYENTDFDTDEFRKQIGVKQLKHDGDKKRVLMYRCRYPSLSFHGIEGARDGLEIETCIPSRVVGKFSIRLAPNQTPEKVADCVRQSVEAAWGVRKSSNKMCLKMTTSVRPWLVDPWTPHYCAARRAIRRVYKVEADLVRDGCSMEAVLLLQKMVAKSMVLLPISGASGGGPHGEEERIRTKSYIEGVKLLGAYMYELSMIKGQIQ